MSRGLEHENRETLEAVNLLQAIVAEYANSGTQLRLILEYRQRVLEEGELRCTQGKLNELGTNGKLRLKKREE